MEQDRAKLVEMARREMARRSFVWFNEMTNKGWKKTRFHEALCTRVQEFIEAETGNPYDVLVITTPPQFGKAMHDETAVFTTSGWKRHGDLKAGDFVYNELGFPVEVQYVHEPILAPSVRVVLDTGEDFICSKQHEWVVEIDHDKGIRTHEIREAQDLFDGYQHRNPAIRVTRALWNPVNELPIDPYVLGLWLGDGHSRSGVITSGSEDLAHLSNYGKQRKASSGFATTVDGLTKKIRENGLKNNKHIPEIYFHACEEDRRSLLAGLMDTDGYVSVTGGTCEYTSIKKRLAKDVLFLCRTLGYKAQMSEGIATLNGIAISPKYRVMFTPSKGERICRLGRKQARIDNKVKKDRKDKHYYFITKVVDVGAQPVRCITVDGGIYCVGRGMVQTHNSVSITETLPAWYLIRNPLHRVILASYGEDFAEKFGRANRLKLSEWGKYYGISLAKYPSGATEFELSNHKGSVISRGIMSGITGRSAELIIIDDPVKNRAEADSESYRERMWNEWMSSLKTRLQAGSKCICIMTRWHTDDLAGRLLDSDPYCQLWRVPCEAEEGDVLGREVGEGLCPEIGKGTDWLVAFKKSFIGDASEGGIRAWNALYQGRPTSQEGNLIRREWFKYHSGVVREPVTVKVGSISSSVSCAVTPEKWDKEWQSWDCAFKDTDSSDFVCGLVFGRRGADYFLRDCVHARLDINGTMDAIKHISNKYPKATLKLMEEKANGAAVIQMLRHSIGGFVAVNPTESKTVRVNAIIPQVQSGNVYLPHPEDASWVQEFLDECAAFPSGRHDDMVDAFSQGLQFYMYDKSSVDKQEIPEGFHVYQMLKMQGWKDMKIRQAMRDGRIKVIGAPKGFA